MAPRVATLVQRQYRHPGTPDRSAAELRIHADSTRRNGTLLYAPGSVLLTETAVKEQAMSRKPYSLSKQLVMATALTLGASSAALADDSSMSRFGGESYVYFNQPVLRNTAANPTWRQRHPNGLTGL